MAVAWLVQVSDYRPAEFTQIARVTFERAFLRQDDGEATAITLEEAGCRVRFQELDDQDRYWWRMMARRHAEGFWRDERNCWVRFLRSRERAIAVKRDLVRHRVGYVCEKVARW